MSVTLQDHVSYPTYLSYLSDRKRQVFIDGVQSDFCNVTCGIPQGSILGPFLFTIYIIDLPSCNLFSTPRMYADDTTLTTSAEDPCVLEHKMNYDMNLIQSWLSANKLTLNVKKTKYMLIESQFNPFAPEPPVRIQVLSTLCDVISFNGQGQLSSLCCAE